ncbi:GNAT family N-acetyltransferase [Legionella sp. D16C41]|uniref:GNAT family N-acetyltransferase n=1 Tax=Legionella sp. D16C41 TaxID=3402688 RepID=UPI003AF5AEC5
MIVLETQRLLLRTWKDTDLAPLTCINQDPKVCRYLPSLGNCHSTKQLIKRCIEHFNTYGFSLYAVELKETTDMIGFIGLLTPSFVAHFTPAIEIGWRLASTQWHKGYATEGAKAVLQYAFTQLNLKELVSFTAADNWPSRRVMERIGLHHNANDDFEHPNISLASPLRHHVLYRLSKEMYLGCI